MFYVLFNFSDFLFYSYKKSRKQLIAILVSKKFNKKGACDPGSDFFTNMNKCENEGNANRIDTSPYCECKCQKGYKGKYCQESKLLDLI